MPGSPRGSDYVLINRHGELIPPSALFGTDLTNGNASQLLDEDVDLIRTFDGKKSCKACNKTYDTNKAQLNVLAKLICHKLLCTKLQYVNT